MATISKLVVSLSADSAKLYKSLAKSRKRIRRWAKGAVANVVSVGASFVHLAKVASLALVGYSAGLTGIIISNAKAIKSMVNMSNAFGVNTTSLQEWEVAAKSVGFESEKIGDIFKDISDKIGDFAVTGGGAAKDIFEGLNLDIKDFIGLSPDVALLKMVDAMDGLAKQDKIFYLEAIASDVSLLLPLLENGGEGFKKLAAEGKKAGLILSEADIIGISKFNKSLAEMGRKARGFGKTLTAQLAPAFDLILTKINDYAEKAGGMRNVAKDFAVSTVKGISAATKAVSGLIGLMSRLQIKIIDTQALWETAHAIFVSGDAFTEGGKKLEETLDRLSKQRFELQLEIANKSEVQKGLDDLAKEIELTFSQPQKVKEKAERDAANATNSLANAANAAAKALDPKEKKIGKPGDRSISEQLYIMENLDQYIRGTLEGVDKFDAKVGLGVSELVIDGNKGRDTENLTAINLASQKTAEAVTKIAQKENGRTSLGQLTINMVTDAGQIAGEIFGEPAFLTDLKSFVDRQTNDSARTAAA